MSALATLWGLRIRRDWRQLAAWLLGTALMAYVSYAGVTQSYGGEADRMAILTTAAANPSVLMMRGLPSGAEEGAFIAFLIMPWLAFLAAMMSSFLAVRHTRMDEELGRADMVSATTASRLIPLGATVLHGITANLLLGVLVALAFTLTGLDATGAWMAGGGTAATGIVFLGVGVVTGQLMRTSRGANSFAVWVLMATFFLSGIGNALGTVSADLTRIDSSFLTWLSPIGWAENVRPWSDNNVGPLLLAVGVSAVAMSAGFVMQSVRDVGESFIAERRGRVAALPTLSTPFGLVWRLTWGAMLGWAIGGVATGALSTSLGSVVSDLGSENPALAEVLEQLSGSGDIARGAVVVFFTMLGVLAACAAVQVITKARAEETRGTAEAVLVTPVARVRWLAGYVLMGGISILAVIAAGILGGAIGLATPDGDWTLMEDVVVAAGGQLVAAGVFLAVASVLFVLAPRLVIGVSWALVLVATSVGLFGPTLGAPEWLVNLAPIAITPELTAAGDIDPSGFWYMLTAVAVGISAALALMRRRELAPGA